MRTLVTALTLVLATAASAGAAPVAKLGADGRLRVVEGERTLLTEASSERIAFRSGGRWHRATA